MALSLYLADKINDHILRNTPYTPPATVYIALFTSSNGLLDNNAALQDEVTGAGYSRLAIDGTTLSFTPSANGLASNNENWEFPKATAPWGIVSHTAVMDAATGGNVLLFGTLQTARDIQTNDIFRFLAGDFDSVFS